jgi:hypothetical protein
LCRRGSEKSNGDSFVTSGLRLEVHAFADLSQQSDIV